MHSQLHLRQTQNIINLPDSLLAVPSQVLTRLWFLLFCVKYSTQAVNLCKPARTDVVLCVLVCGVWCAMSQQCLLYSNTWHSWYVVSWISCKIYSVYVYHILHWSKGNSALFLGNCTILSCKTTDDFIIFFFVPPSTVWQLYYMSLANLALYCECLLAQEAISKNVWLV